MDQCIPLYALANSLDPSITHLLHQQERLEKDLSTSEIGIVEGRKICDDLRQKFEQAKQTLFATLPIPSTSAPPSVSIPPVGIMDHIVKIVLEVSNAHVVAITQNAIIVAPTIDVGLVDQDEGDGGNLNTSSTESNNMITDSIANP